MFLGGVITVNLLNKHHLSVSSVTMLRLPVLGEGVQHGNVPLHGECEGGEHGPDLGGDWIVGEESEI